VAAAAAALFALPAAAFARRLLPPAMIAGSRDAFTVADKRDAGGAAIGAAAFVAAGACLLKDDVGGERSPMGRTGAALRGILDEGGCAARAPPDAKIGD
jgi:hypothetical protein